MSLPYFDPEVTLNVGQAAGVRVVLDDFHATGALGDEESQVLRVFVSIWQTEADIADDGLATKFVARALGEGGRDPKDKGKWSAKLTMLEGEFQADKPATGLGHLVESGGDDPTGFSTYTWTTRLKIKNP